jgi:hypothetical protein
MVTWVGFRLPNARANPSYTRSVFPGAWCFSGMTGLDPTPTTDAGL